MTIQLSKDGLRAIFPKAPQPVIDAFVAKQAFLDAKGVTHTRTRLAYFFANIEHECGGFTIPNLTENINYTAERMAAVWPNRFPGGASQVRSKYGTAAGWQLKAFDDIYGNRMGNRPGTRDGSTFIGRGGPQVTGREGYASVAKHSGVPLNTNAALACSNDLQPEVCAGFWDWKGLNKYADTGNFLGCVKIWNGGTNGLADRQAKMAGNDPAIARLATMKDVALPAAMKLLGNPPTPKPPKSATDDATKNERKSRAAAGTVAAGGAANEVAPSKPMPSVAAYGLVAVCIVAVAILTILIIRKKAAVVANWF